MKQISQGQFFALSPAQKLMRSWDYRRGQNLSDEQKRSVPCVACRAKPSFPCKKKNGKGRGSFHAVRIRDAQRAEDARVDAPNN